MENNNYKILGILFLCEFGITLLIFLIFVALFIINLGLVISSYNDSNGLAGMFAIYAAILVIYIAFMSPFGIAGWKLIKNRSGAKFWGVVASIFSIPFFFPFGIIISILGFVFLFTNTGNVKHQNFDVQPRNYNPPQNWQ